MKVIVTGGLGFLGQRLARRLLECGRVSDADGRLVDFDELVLIDTQPTRCELQDERLTCLHADVSDPQALAASIDRPDVTVFHLASVVSAGAEQDFDLALRVNLDGHRALLEALRGLQSRPRYVFTSSLAVYGGDAVRAGVDDATALHPRTTYGMTKAIGELLVDDYTRKGYIDGRGARLGMVIVRPGAPNKAASGFASAVIREPLDGKDYVLPVPLDTRVAVVGYDTVIDGLLALQALDGAALGAERTLNLPSLSVTVEQMLTSLRRVAGGRQLGRVDVQPDEFIMSVVNGWPQAMHAPRAQALGLPQDAGLDDIIQRYMREFSADAGAAQQ